MKKYKHQQHKGKEITYTQKLYSKLGKGKRFREPVLKVSSRRLRSACSTASQRTHRSKYKPAKKPKEIPSPHIQILSDSDSIDLNILKRPPRMLTARLPQSQCSLKPLKKHPIPLEKILQEKQNFPWEEIDFHNDFNKNAFIDNILERNELKEMTFKRHKGATKRETMKGLALPDPFQTTLELEAKKQTLVIKINCLITSIKSYFNRKKNESW